MQKYVIEFTGTMLLVLVVALTGNAIAIGAAVMGLVYMGGAISGGHYNPAISLAHYLRGKLSSKEMWRYMGVQLAGAFVAAALYYLIKGMWFIPKPGDGVNYLAAGVVEVLFTLMLALTVLEVGTSQKTKGNDYFGLAIGAVVIAIVFAGGPVSGGLFNPAIGVGTLLFDIANIPSHLGVMALYIIGPFLGAIAAAQLFNNTKD